MVRLLKFLFEEFLLDFKKILAKGMLPCAMNIKWQKLCTGYFIYWNQFKSCITYKTIQIELHRALYKDISAIYRNNLNENS